MKQGVYIATLSIHSPTAKGTRAFFRTPNQIVPGNRESPYNRKKPSERSGLSVLARLSKIQSSQDFNLYGRSTTLRTSFFANLSRNGVPLGVTRTISAQSTHIS